MDLTVKDNLENLFDYVLEKNKSKSYDYIPRDNKKRGKGKFNKNKSNVPYDYFAYLAQNPTDNCEIMPPVYHKNIVLAYAFNVAYKNLHDLMYYRDELATKGPKEKLKQNCELAVYEFIHSHNKEALQKIKVIGDNSMVMQFFPMAKLLYKLLWGYRNYFSHYFHEHEVLGYTDMPQDIPIHNPSKRLTKSEWEQVRDWIKGRFDESFLITSQSLEDRKVENKENRKIESQIYETLKRIKETMLLSPDNVFTHDGFLFTVCMFLRKSQAEYVLRKWDGIKRTEGYYKTVGTFFTRYAIPDKYSLLSEHNDMRCFRTIVSMLSHVPYHNHPDLKIFYKKIDELNIENANNILEKEAQINTNSSLIWTEKKQDKEDWDHNKLDKLKKDITNIKREIKEFKKKFISRRTHTNITHWLLRYLQDRELLRIDPKSSRTVEIAYYKTNEDYNNEINSLFDGKTLMVYKQETKHELDPLKKKQRNENIRAFKRNFLFKPIEKGYYRFCVKKNNALFRITTNINNQLVTVQTIISPKILAKWVFIDLMNNQEGNKVLKNIIEYIEQYGTILSKHAVKDITAKQASVGNVTFKKAFPYSLRENFERTIAYEKNKTKITDKEIEKHINFKKQAIDNFIAENEAQSAPWKYASRKKINWIFNYIHFTYLVDAYSQGKSDDDIRHECLREDTYLEAAFKYIRFYRAYRTTDEFREFFKIPYFNHIRPRFGNSERLEQLFKDCLKGKGGYWDRLDTIQITDENRAMYARIFKLHKYAETENIEKEIKPLLLRNMSLPPDCIALKNYTLNVQQNHRSKYDNTTDFSVIRHILEQKDTIHQITNIDFIIQNIYPKILQDEQLKNQLPKNKNGNTNRAIISNFMKMKTDELLLWHIAKYYWKSATRQPYLIDRNIAKPVKNLAYKNNIFNTLFEKELIIPIFAFYKKEKRIKQVRYQNKPCYLKISAKKFDDELQYFESSYLKDYIEWYYQVDKQRELQKKQEYHTNKDKDKKKKEPPSISHEIADQVVLYYTFVNQRIKSTLVRHLDDIYLILQNEKELLLEDINLFKYYKVYNSFNECVENNNYTLRSFYQDFETINLFFIPEIVTSINDFKFKLKEMRNNALHYQLQDPTMHKELTKKLINRLKRTNKVKPNTIVK